MDGTGAEGERWTAEAKRVTLSRPNGSLEIGRLKERNSALLQQLKRLNAELDSKITNIVPTRPEPVKPEVAEGKLRSELECIQKMTAMYSKEIEGLNAKLQVKAGPEQLVDLTKQLQDCKQQQELVQREIKATQKRSKDFEKLLAKTTSLKESEVSQLEVRTHDPCRRSVFSKSSTRKPIAPARSSNASSKSASSKPCARTRPPRSSKPSPSSRPKSMRTSNEFRP